MVPMRSQSGFSLVELSIVLVILGLLVGGVLTGQSLIRAAELRAVSTEYSRWVTATQTFRDKYFALPGDMPNATAFWGSMSSGTCPNATGGTGTQTCNGNGDGIIGLAGGAGRSGENLLYWQHLANAGIIEGRFTGVSGPNNSSDTIIGVNVPSLKGNAMVGWSLHMWIPSGHSWMPNNLPANKFFLGRDDPIEWTYGRWLKPEEAWGIDTKIDDGKPLRGVVQASFDSGCTAAANSSDFNTEYSVINQSAVCMLILVLP